MSNTTSQEEPVPLAERTDDDSPLLTIAKRYGRKDVGWLIIASLSSGLKTFISFADVFLIGLGIDALFNDRQFIVPLLPQSWVPEGQLELLIFITALLVGLNLATNVFSFISEWGFGIFSQRLVHRTRVEIFDEVQQLELSFFEDERTGNLLSILNDDTNQLDSFFSTLISSIIWIVITLVSAVVYMWLLNPQLAIVVLLAAPLMAWMNHKFSERLEPLQGTVRRQRGVLNSRLETALSGMQVIKAFNAEKFEQDRVAETSRGDISARLNSVKESARHPPLNRLVLGGWLLIVTIVGIYWIVIGPPGPFFGTLTAGQLIPFLFYLERLTLPMQNLGGVIDGYTSTKASANRILGTTAAVSGAAASAKQTSESEEELQIDSASVEFENVNYSYPGREQLAIDNVSLAIDGDDTVGIVGTSGAGKSTLTELLIGFRSPDEGQISVDGQSVDTVSEESLRAAVGYVSQDPHLFDGTIKENIAYGGNDLSDDTIREAAKIAGAHQFIEDLTDSYDTEIGSQGSSLSGGQRQRIAVARAIVDEPPILILDEATSQVDTETERELQQNLSTITEDRTTIVVAHRLSMVKDADEIVVLEDGQITENGTHDELVSAQQTYARLWDIQVGNVSAV